MDHWQESFYDGESETRPTSYAADVDWIHPATLGGLVLQLQLHNA